METYIKDSVRIKQQERQKDMSLVLSKASACTKELFENKF